MHSTTILRGVAACLPLLALPACSGSWDLRHRRTVEIRDGTAIDAKAARVRIELDVADVDLRPSADRQLSVEGKAVLCAEEEEYLADMTAAPRFELRGDTLVVSDPRQHASGRTQVNYQLRVALPPDLPVRVQVGVGKVTVEHWVADVKVNSGVGDVRAAWCQGKTDLESGVGNIRVVGHQGGLRADTGVGDLRVDLADGAGAEPVNLETGVGDVDVATPRADRGRVKASAGVGEVRVRHRSDGAVRPAAIPQSRPTSWVH